MNIFLILWVSRPFSRMIPRSFSHHIIELKLPAFSAHRQQCNATTYMLLTACCCKNFAITIFTWGSLWVVTLFFLLLFDRSCRFPRCSNSKLSLSIPSVVQSKKVGRDMNTHLRRRSYAPRQTAPLGPSHFLSKTFSRPALEVNRSSPKIAGQDAHYGIASQYH